MITRKFAVWRGFGGRYKLGKRWSVNMEYGHAFRTEGASLIQQSVFYWSRFRNWRAHFPVAFHQFSIYEYQRRFWNQYRRLGDSDVYFGFNLARSF